MNTDLHLRVPVRYSSDQIPGPAVQEWREDAEMLRAWQRGRTGYPLVDAGMRQLWLTGWMQQSIRMVCAAFLTEYLNMHWIHGERYALTQHISSLVS